MHRLGRNIVTKPVDVDDELSFTASDTFVYGAPKTAGAVDCCTTEMLFTMTGTYTVKEGLYDIGAYALSTESVFVQAKSPEQTLNPYHWYLTIATFAATFFRHD